MLTNTLCSGSIQTELKLTQPLSSWHFATTDDYDRFVEDREQWGAYWMSLCQMIEKQVLIYKLLLVYNIANDILETETLNALRRRLQQFRGATIPRVRVLNTINLPQAQFLTVLLFSIRRKNTAQRPVSKLQWTWQVSSLRLINVFDHSWMLYAKSLLQVPRLFDAIFFCWFCVSWLCLNILLICKICLDLICTTITNIRATNAFSLMSMVFKTSLLDVIDRLGLFLAGPTEWTGRKRSDARSCPVIEKAASRSSPLVRRARPSGRWRNCCKADQARKDKW